MLMIIVGKTGNAVCFFTGKRRYDRKQSGYGGQTKPIFHKKVKYNVMIVTDKVVFRIGCPSGVGNCLK